ncbi:hypothetical protein PPYR_01375 [Photinus pyralis]|uniref:TFIIS N-terminal domain-containing protein n=2 Tax=Photinus pyralis TaxID=7054 RepID=A0A1Y1LGW3_PHOPY|nr:transcription elongation factor B polypeptide 3-like isoform X1 [Photinus pyralis]XP_031353389.1 transcription elongation factor B polypeptide 3-like isoform X1 [Photinus pyralis]KAB0800486.1 hypothetical protein PPYR_06226 [Photinus pyralis]KAB0804405.1 hypothetical protein PPYR_01375 [Photinus pyralis]
MEEKGLIAGILHYQHCLDKYARRNDEARVLYCLSKLYKMPICIEHLEKTGVGRTVNSLRKLNGDIGEAAKTLVGKWKEMVAAISDEKETNSVPKIEPAKKQETDKEKCKSEKEHNSSHRGSDKRSSFLTETKSHSRKTQEESSSYNEDTKIKRDNGKSHYSQSSSVSDDENTSKKSVNEYKNKKEYSKHKSKRKRDSSEESQNESDSEKHRSKFHKSRADETLTKNKKLDNKQHDESSDEETSHSKQTVRKKVDDKPSKSSSNRDKDVDRKSQGGSSSKHRKTNSKRYTSESEEEEVVKSKHKSHSSRDKSSSSKHKKSSRDDEKEENRKSKHKQSKKDEKSSSKCRPKQLSDSEEDTNRNGFDSDESDNDVKVERKKIRTDEKKDKVKDEPKLKKSKGSSDKSDKRHSSSSSSKSEKKSSRKSNIEIGENGICSGSGASFAEALGMCVSSSKASKKKVAVVRPYSPDNAPSNVPELLTPTKKLTPLDVTVDNLLPEITPNYRPMGLPYSTGSKKVINDDEVLGALMYSKISRTKVYSGNKVAWGAVPSLFDICTRVLQDNIDALEYTGGVPYLILKPVIERANPDQLFMLEHHNPYLIEDTDELWQLHCNKEFRSKKREELETWRDMYMRCLDEREAKLQALTANIKQSQDKSLPVRQTKLAYVDSVVKPPRNILRKQAKHGTGSLEKRPAITPSARLSQIAVSGAAGQVAVPNPGPRAASSTGAPYSTAIVKPKKAPLMQKTLALMKSRIFRR